MLDSTGLCIVGAGEWATATHGGRGRRGWRKLHLGVDQSGAILVHTLTEATGDDATTALVTDQLRSYAAVSPGFFSSLLAARGRRADS